MIFRDLRLADFFICGGVPFIKIPTYWDDATPYNCINIETREPDYVHPLSRITREEDPYARKINGYE